MPLSPKIFYLANVGSFILLTIVIVSYSLSVIPLAIGISLIVYNLYSIVNHLNKQPNKSRIEKSYLKAPARSKNIRDEKMNQFEKKVRQAYDQSLSKQAERYRSDDYSWSKNYSKQSSEIGQLRKASYSTYQQENAGKQFLYLDEGSSSKKVRNFFMEKKEDSIFGRQSKRQYIQIKKQILEAIKIFFEKAPTPFKEIKIKQNDQQIGKCLKLMNQFIDSKIDYQIDNIIEDFEVVSKFLSRCFSLSLTLQKPNSQKCITHAQLNQLINIIENKHLVPTRFIPNIEMFEISKQLAKIKDNFLRLPNFSVPPNILKLAIGLKYLRKLFPDEYIICADMKSDQKPKKGDQHIIKLYDNERFFYHYQPQIKVKQPSVIILLISIRLLPKYYNTTKQLMRELCMQLGVKHF